MKKATAIIKGTNCEKEHFEEEVIFTLIPPNDDNHYGNGYYMTIKTPYDKKIVDVRYAKTTDILKLAECWIEKWYGDNAEEVDLTEI